VARSLKCYLVAGLLEVAGGKRFNTATLFDRRGRLVGRQRQVTVGAAERQHLAIAPGEASYRAFDTDFGRVGLPVGIDFWGQPDATRAITEQGADLVINSSIFPILLGHWKSAALTRALENFVPVVASTRPISTFVWRQGTPPARRSKPHYPAAPIDHQRRFPRLAPKP